MSQVLETRAAERPDPGGAVRWWRSAPTFFSVLAIFTSGAVFLAVFLTTRSADQDRLRLEYIRIAVGILRPPKPTEPQRELRRWAVDVLNKSAEVKLSTAQAQALIDGTSVLSGSGWNSDGWDIGDYGYNDYRRLAPERSATPKPNP